MNPALQLTESVSRKLKLVLERYDALTAENAALKSAVNQLKATVETLSTENGELKEELRQARMAGVLRETGSGDVEETKATLAELVREIDKCIALLNA